MYHPYRKDSSYLRTAIFTSYHEKCSYCGRTIQARDMQVDHIIPTNLGVCNDPNVNQYLSELESAGFIRDCIENYLPACPACNLEKSNRAYTASNLRYYHEMARSHIDDILSRIAILKTKSAETFFEPIDSTVWESLDFSYQRPISYAIMGYRLTPDDVEACPFFPQVERLEKRLSIVDYVVLQGETGCGKSISVYQTAYAFFKKGWRVYKYRVTDKLTIPTIPTNTEQSLYIIDDAQLFPAKVMEMIANQARPNRKIIFAKTVAHGYQADTVLLTNKDAVEILYQDYLKRKDEIVPIVRQCDDRIGISFMDSRIEWRLEDARKASTPWQFNYILRGGWKSIKEQYQSISSHRNCGMLASIIAAFQIAQLDLAVDYSWLCSWIKGIDTSLNWSSADLQYLIDKKLVLSADDVRIVHLEGAKAILSLHYEDRNWGEDILRKIIERAFLEGRFKPLGMVWLCNGMHGNLWRTIDPWLISEKMIAFALEDLQNITSPDARMGIAFFMEKVYTMGYEKNGHWCFGKNKEILLNWFEYASSENAYAYSDLINTVYNKSHTEHKEFASRINWMQFFSSLDNETAPKLYSWGKLVERLAIGFNKYADVSAYEAFHASLDTLVCKATSKNIIDLSNFFSQVVHLSPEYVHAAIRKLIPVYQTAFKTNMSGSLEIFLSDFLGYICGMGWWSSRPTKTQKETALALVTAIPEEEFANTISNSYPRDWRTIFDIICLISKYDQKKARNTISKVDTQKLSDMAKDVWEDSDDILHLCCALANGSNRIARQFVERNQDRIHVMYSPLVAIAPQCAVELFERRIRIDIMSEHWWYYSYHALKELIKADSNVATQILAQSIPVIAERLNAIHAHYMEDRYCLAFIQLVFDFDPAAFDQLLEKLDESKIAESWSKSYNYPYKKKTVEKRYKSLMNLLQIQVSSP